MSKILLMFVIAVMIPDCESGKGQYRHGSGHHQENSAE
jgi:hypothetical protein